MIESSEAVGRQWEFFSEDRLPRSVNHQYIKTRYSVRLDPDVHEFRKQLSKSMHDKGLNWKPTGLSAAVILLQSPRWVTQERIVAKRDADNKVKPIFDAIQEASQQPDENHWHFHVFKVLGERERLTVYLFDLGDVVEYYY